MTPQRFAIAESRTLRDRFQLLRGGGQFCFGDFRPQARDEACRSHADLLGKDAAKIAIAHADAAHQGPNREIGVQMF